MKKGKRLKQLRVAKGLTQIELAQLLHTTKQTVSKYENSIVTNIPSDRIERLAEILDTTPEFILGWDETPRPETLPAVFRPVKMRKYPILGNVACGDPILATEQHDAFVYGDEIAADFCLIAKGDSMINARIFDGDAVFIKATPEVENGDIAAVIIGDEATLKRVYYYPDENKIALVPENPLYRVQYYQGEALDQIRIVGKAVALQTEVH